MSGKWGLHIGATLEKQCERGLLAKDLSSSIVIRTSAASDARMGGATLPAMSNSGSGNQGITATMPVVVVAEHFGADDERLARALMLSHLSAIYIHNQLPRLSALCVNDRSNGGRRRDGMAGGMGVTKPSRLGDQQYDRRCQRHDLRWCVEQLRDEGLTSASAA